MIGIILKIVVGLFLWLMLPGMIKVRNSNARNFVNICCTVVGILVVISAVVEFFRYLF